MNDEYNLLFSKFLETNDERIFGQIFDHFYPRLYKFSIRLVHHPMLAEEVVSDVFYKLLNRKKSNHIEDISFYLFRATKNQSITILQKQNRNSIIETLANEDDYLIKSGQNPEKDLQDSEVQHLLKKAIDNLPSQRRMVFKLIREEGLNYHKVSELLGISPRTVETHMSIAIKDLCETLKEYLENQRQHAKIRKIFPR